MTEELKPCPFCGDADIDPAFWMCDDQTCGPGCNGCGATANTSEAWNFRAPLPDVAAQGNATALQAFEFLLDNELHAEDEHDDDCPTCQAIRTIRAALSALPAQGQPNSGLAKLIADKAAEPALDRIKTAWVDPAASRWLQITKVSPTGVDKWIVRLSSGKEIILTEAEWNGAIFNADHAEIVPANPSDPLVEFFHWAMENGPFEGCELDGGDVQEKAAALGLIEPAKDRTDWWVYTSAAKRRSPAASAEIRDRIFWIMSRIRASSDAAAIADYLSQHLALPSQPDTATKPEPRG